MRGGRKCVDERKIYISFSKYTLIYFSVFSIYTAIAFHELGPSVSSNRTQTDSSKDELMGLVKCRLVLKRGTISSRFSG